MIANVLCGISINRGAVNFEIFRIAEFFGKKVTIYRPTLRIGPDIGMRNGIIRCFLNLKDLKIILKDRDSIISTSSRINLMHQSFIKNVVFKQNLQGRILKILN